VKTALSRIQLSVSQVYYLMTIKRLYVNTTILKPLFYGIKLTDEYAKTKELTELFDVTVNATANFYVTVQDI
jgi:hypothetical protein